MLAIQVGVEIIAPLLDLNVWQNTPFRDMGSSPSPKESMNAASAALLCYRHDLQISRLSD